MGKYIIVSNHNQNSSQSLRSSPPLRPPLEPHQPSVSVTLISQLPERTTTTPRSSGAETGPNIELLTLTTKTAVSLSPTTGRVPNSALNPGSAEVPDFAREVDGAPDTTDVREPHSQTRPQDSPRITEHAGRAA